MLENVREKKILETLNYYIQELRNRGYKVIYIALYGSQNYNVDDEKSDIDAKAIVLPTLKDIIHRQPISAKLETEFGNVDYKDIITFNNVIRKGNFSYIEAIHSHYRIGDLKTIDRLFGNIKVNYKSVIGGMKEKRKALTHEYPSKKEEFKQFNCDPKQFHHIIRLWDVLQKDLKENKNLSFLTYDNEKQRKYMIDLKRKLVYPLEETIATADAIITVAEIELYRVFPNYKYEPIDNLEAVDEYIEKMIRYEILDKEKDI